MAYNKDSWSVILRGGFDKGFDVEIKSREESKEDSGEGFSKWGEFPLEVMISSSKFKIVSRGVGHWEVY